MLEQVSQIDAGHALIKIAEVLAIADRILIIRAGLIAAATTPSETDEEGLNLMIQGAG